MPVRQRCTAVALAIAACLVPSALRGNEKGSSAGSDRTTKLAEDQTSEDARTIAALKKRIQELENRIAWYRQRLEAQSGTDPQVALSDSPSGHAPLGLDGCCPVSLCESPLGWTPGDPRWGAVYRGRTYLFAGPEEQTMFLKTPDRYAPALSGYDPVIALEQGKYVPGKREHGGFCRGRIFLLFSDATYEKFKQNHEAYIAATAVVEVYELLYDEPPNAARTVSSVQPD